MYQSIPGRLIKLYLDKESSIIKAVEQGIERGNFICVRMKN